MVGAGANLLELLGCDERIIGDIGPLEQIVPDTFGTLEPLGVDLARYELRSRVDQIRNQLLAVLKHLKV